MTSNKKRAALVYSLNALMVIFALFLSYRLISPQYVRKESSAVNKLGSFHTQLAAERLGARLGTLREELKENGMRIVDSARGPVALDASRWMWVRIQDRDWRAPKYLEPLPPPRTDIDTWEVSYVQNSYVISERIPIMKDGVLDYVILEGGLRPNIFQDIQSDSSFGVWVFDLKAYEKGGLGAAKLYERSSVSGALSKDEVKLLTSDLLMDLFQKQSFVELTSKVPWVVSFKNASGPSRLGILGYWLPEAKPINMLYIWFSLGAVLLFLSAAISYYILRTTPESEEWVDTAPAQRALVASSSSRNEGVKNSNVEISTATLTLKGRSFEGLFEWIASFAREMNSPLQDLNDRLKSFKNLNSSLVEAPEVKKELSHFEVELSKTFSLLARLESYFGRSPAKAEVFDVEVYFKELENTGGKLPKMDAFFDPDLWRVHASKEDLSHLIRCYSQFLFRRTTTEKKVHFSARFFAAEIEEASSVDVLGSKAFKVPFVRLSFYIKTNNPIGRTQMAELFDLEKTKDRAETEMALTPKLVLNMNGRLRMKSSFDEGIVLNLDIPAAEERRAEDKVNVKQMKSQQSPSELVEAPPTESRAESFHQDELESKTVLSQSGIIAQSAVENKEEAPSSTLRLADIEKANSFAENISDERSRVRSRFRVRKPGEKT